MCSICIIKALPEVLCEKIQQKGACWETNTALRFLVVSRNPQVLYSIRISGVSIVIWYCFKSNFTSWLAINRLWVQYQWSVWLTCHFIKLCYFATRIHAFIKASAHGREAHYLLFGNLSLPLKSFKPSVIMHKVWSLPCYIFWTVLCFPSHLFI